MPKGWSNLATFTTAEEPSATRPAAASATAVRARRWLRSPSPVAAIAARAHSARTPPRPAGTRVLMARATSRPASAIRAPDGRRSTITSAASEPTASAAPHSSVSW